MKKLNPWLIVLFVLALTMMYSQSANVGRPTVNYSEFQNLLQQDRVERVDIVGSRANVQLTESTNVSVDTPSGMQQRPAEEVLVQLPATSAVRDDELIPALREQGVTVNFREPSQWLNIFLSLLPLLMFGALIYFFFIRAQSSQGGMMQFGQSKAKKYGKENKVETKFTDVAGHEEAKKELVEVVDFLKNPGKYHQIGAEIPKGVLLVGPPGTGKTLLALSLIHI